MSSSDDKEEVVDIEGDFHVPIGQLMVNSTSSTLKHRAVDKEMVATSDDIDADSKATILKIMSEDSQTSIRYGFNYPLPSPSQRTSQAMENTSRRQRWSSEQHSLFLTGLEIYGRSWKQIAGLIPDKTANQVKSHAVKYFMKLEREKEKARQTQDNRVHLTSKLSSAHPLSESVDIVDSKEVQVIEESQQDEDVDILNDSSGGSSGCSSEEQDDYNADDIHLSAMMTSHSHSRLLQTAPPFQSDSVDDEDKSLIQSRLPRDVLVSVVEKRVDGHNISAATLNVDKSPIKLERSTTVTTSDSVVDDESVPSQSVSELIDDDPFREQGLIGSLDEVDMFTDKPVQLPPDTDVKSPLSQPQLSAAGGDSAAEVTSPATMFVKTEPVELQMEEESSQDTSADSADGELPLYHVANQVEYGVLNSNGELIPMQPPDKECQVNRDEITDFEKGLHFEFFENRTNKTPDRYKKIRNYILDQWDKVKPSYLNKTCVRAGLKSCGDVNGIGRIHSYLEQLGAINFGCEPGGDNNQLADVTQSTGVVSPSVRQRKRRPKDHSVYVEGITKQHNPDEVVDRPPLKTVKVTPGRPMGDSYMLVSCSDFSESQQGCPYQVHLESTAAVLIDIHAHLCKTEVIGLLGGVYDESSKVLKVLQAQPCSAHSTSIHCDMDPVSQTQAGELISAAGLQVVGWYHSHPTFVPDPSKQDIESQVAFQTWFSQGGDHFLGLIISPYNINNNSVNSEIRCFTTATKRNGSNQGSKGKDGNLVPFKFDYTIVTSAEQGEILSLVAKVTRLLSMYKDYEHCVDLLDTYRSTSDLTSLDKMMASVEGHLRTADSSQVDVTALLEDLRFLLTTFAEKNNC